MAPSRESVGREVRGSAQLDDALRDLVRVALFLVRVLEELLGHALGMNPARHEVMATVPQDADEFGRERSIEKLQHGLAVRRIARRDGAFIDVQSRTGS